MPRPAKPDARVKPYRTPITAWRVTDLEGRVIPAQIIEDRRGRRYLQVLDANGVWDGRSIPFFRVSDHLVAGVPWRRRHKLKKRQFSHFLKSGVSLTHYSAAA